MPFKHTTVKRAFLSFFVLQINNVKLVSLYFLTSNNSTSKIKVENGLIGPPSRGVAP